MVWANYTWGSPWHGDPKQNGAAVALLVFIHTNSSPALGHTLSCPAQILSSLAL